MHAVFRMHQKHIVDFTPGRPHVSPAQAAQRATRETAFTLVAQRLGACDQLVEWLKPLDCPDWMDEAQFAQLPEGLQVRELRYQVQRKGFRVKTITLVTTLVDTRTLPR